MIKSKFYDVEILKNFFSITIIDITSYLEVMKDACDEKVILYLLFRNLLLKKLKKDWTQLNLKITILLILMIASYFLCSKLLMI